MLYSPALLDEVCTLTPVSVLVTVMVALGMAAPVGSMTRPEMVPRNSCAPETATA